MLDLLSHTGKTTDHSAKLEVSQNQTRPTIIVSTLVLAKLDVATWGPGPKPAGVFACLAVPHDKDRVRVCIWRLEQKKKNKSKNQ